MNKYKIINIQRNVAFFDFQTKQENIKKIEHAMIIPYYTGKIQLKSGINFVHLEYQTYSELQDSGIYQINIQ